MRRFGTVGKNSSIVATETVERKIHTFRRALDPEAVRVLVAVYALSGTEFVEISHFFGRYMPGVTTGRGGLFPRLRWWGLVEVMHRDENEVQGMWRVTPEGAAFVEGKTKLPRFVDEREAEVVTPPYGESYGVKRFAGWMYDFERARAAIRLLGEKQVNVLRYFDTQWTARGA